MFRRNDYISIRDKKEHNFSVYDIYGRGLSIKSFTINDNGTYKGFIKSFEFALYKNGEYSTYKGKSQKELIDFLKTISKTKKVYSKHKKEIMVIFTTNLLQVRGFLQNVITDDDSEHYFQVFDTIEFRDINKWIETEDDAKCIAKSAHELIHNVFIPDNFFYITPNQRPRKIIKKAIKNNNIAPSLMPSSEKIFINDREALYAGIMFTTLIGYTYTVRTEPLIYYDLTSAYPFAMIALKHPMTPMKQVEAKHYLKYIDDYFTIGTYKITYVGGDRRLKVYGMKYANDEPITVFKTLCGEDLKTISKLCDKIEIECLSLKISELDYLPKEIIDEVVKAYKNKQSLKGCGVAYDLSKKVVNGISGDLSRKPWDLDFNNLILTNKDFRELYHDKYKEFREKCIFSMYWGISVLSYVRAILVEVSLKLQAIYGDTDGLFCYDTYGNRTYIEDYNSRVSDLIIELGYNDILGIGEFKVECDNITRFKSFGIKTYVYEHNGIITPKICGMKKELSSKIDEQVFDDDYKLDYGHVIEKKVFSDKVSYNGYISDGYYAEYQRDLNNPIDILNMMLTIAKGGKIKGE